MSISGFGLEDEEIQFAQSSRIKSFPFTIETATLEMSQRLRGRLAGQPSGWLERYVQFLNHLDPDDLRAAVRRHLTPDSLWIVVVCSVDEACRSAFLKRYPVWSLSTSSTTTRDPKPNER